MDNFKVVWLTLFIFCTISRVVPMEYGRNFNALVKSTEAQNARINYSVFEGGSHMYTWSVAYTIEGIRDWLFSQTKAE